MAPFLRLPVSLVPEGEMCPELEVTDWEAFLVQGRLLRDLGFGSRTFVRGAWLMVSYQKALPIGTAIALAPSSTESPLDQKLQAVFQMRTYRGLLSIQLANIPTDAQLACGVLAEEDPMPIFPPPTFALTGAQ